MTAIFRKCFPPVTLPNHLLKSGQQADSQSNGGIFCGDPVQMCELIGYLGFTKPGLTVVVGADDVMRKRICQQFPGIALEFVSQPPEHECLRVVHVNPRPWSNRALSANPCTRRWYFTRYAELLDLEHAQKITKWVRNTMESSCIEDLLQIGRRTEIHTAVIPIIGSPLRQSSLPRVVGHAEMCDLVQRALVISSRAEMERIVANWWAKRDQYEVEVVLLQYYPPTLKMLHAFLHTLRTAGFRGECVVSVDHQKTLDVQREFRDTLFRSVEEAKVLRRIINLN